MWKFMILYDRGRQNRASGVSRHLWPAGRDHFNPVFLKLPHFLYQQCQLPEKKVSHLRHGRVAKPDHYWCLRVYSVTVYLLEMDIYSDMSSVAKRPVLCALCEEASRLSSGRINLGKVLLLIGSWGRPHSSFCFSNTQHVGKSILSVALVIRVKLCAICFITAAV